MQYPCNQLLNASLLMSEANFKELLPILPKVATSAADLAYVDPCRYERRCFYYPNDAEIVSRHGAYQDIRFVPKHVTDSNGWHCTSLHNNAL